jgi:hypothetical protein
MLSPLIKHQEKFQRLEEASLEPLIMMQWDLKQDLLIVPKVKFRKESKLFIQ